MKRRLMIPVLGLMVVGGAVAQGWVGPGAASGTPGPTSAPMPDLAVKTLDAETFRKLHAEMAPRGERWMEIPWETDLQAARQRAARERKPLLMWVMDGHPLGCT